MGRDLGLLVRVWHMFSTATAAGDSDSDWTAIAAGDSDSDGTATAAVDSDSDWTAASTGNSDGDWTAASTGNSDGRWTATATATAAAARSARYRRCRRPSAAARLSEPAILAGTATATQIAAAGDRFGSRSSSCRRE
ncbi:MAG: hypothetical protein ACM3ZE_13710 [Myxococcales bacterium]